MRKDLFFTFIVLFFPLGLMAQHPGATAPFREDVTRAAFFGGYSYGRNAGNGFSGWEGQGTFNFTRNLGITADINSGSLSPFGFSALGFSAGTYQRLTSYLVGPTVTANLGRSSVFGHALFWRGPFQSGSRDFCSDHWRDLTRHYKRGWLRYGVWGRRRYWGDSASGVQGSGRRRLSPHSTQYPRRSLQRAFDRL